MAPALPFCTIYEYIFFLINKDMVNNILEYSHPLTLPSVRKKSQKNAFFLDFYSGVTP